MKPADSLLVRLSEHLRAVRERLELVPLTNEATRLPLGELLDSMGLIEFLLRVADDCGTSLEAIEDCVDHRFGSLEELAVSLSAAGFAPRGQPRTSAVQCKDSEVATFCLAGISAILPEGIQAASAIDALLRRPTGWLEQHTGIRQRRIWGDEDPVAKAAEVGRVSLERAGLPVEKVGALLVTGEAPPLLAGLAAALHHRLGLSEVTPAFEIGNACVGFLSACWLARSLVQRLGTVLIIAVEAPSRCLPIEPGERGEFSALFGDAVAAAVITNQPPDGKSISLLDVQVGARGDLHSLLQLEPVEGRVGLNWHGEALARRALETMARSEHDLTRTHGLEVQDLAGLVIHGGNGRLPPLLARRLGLPPERLWSTTPETGNLGAASLPVAWALRQEKPSGPVLWLTVGAGLAWGAALTK